MPDTISAIEDRASVFYRGRALLSAIADTIGMDTNAWRTRLRDTLTEKKLSKREVSLAAGAGAGYLHGILDEGKDPTIQRLAAVCAAIPVSLTYILYGFDISPEDEAIISAMHEAPEKRDAVLTLLRQR